MAVASAFESLFCADALTLSSTAAWLSCCSSLINPPVSLSIKGASATVSCHSNYRRNRVKHKLRQANPARSDVDAPVEVIDLIINAREGLVQMEHAAEMGIQQVSQQRV